MSRGWLGRGLFGMVRSEFPVKLLRFMFAHLSFALPIQRLRETQTLLAFYHPQPSYQVHILIVPKRAIASLVELRPEDGDFFNDLFQTVKNLVVELGLEQGGYRLIANGGKYQEIQQLHFHLIADSKE